MRDDEEILADVAHQLDWDDRIEAKNISIRVVNGNVHLDGEVPTMTGKFAAYDDAQQVEGVASVTNNLDVQISSTKTIPSDAQIRENALASLSINRNLDAYSIDVIVEKGWVTLEGTVQAFWEKISAEKEVLDINGVLGVSNKLAVVPTEKYQDEAMANEIVNALKRNVQVNAEDIEVKVEKGKVTLEGAVKTLNEKRAAYESAIYTPGVVAVNNKIVVG